MIDAVIELRFDTSISDDKIGDISKKLKSSGYPFQSNNLVIHSGLGFPLPDLLEQNIQIDKGFKLTDGPHQIVATIMPQSISSAHLAPYTNWETLFDAFQNVYLINKKICGYRKVTRVGARFINRIDIPLNDCTDRLNIADYLTTGLQVPAGISVNNYQVAFQLDLDNSFQAMVQTASIQPELPMSSALILDIDISIEKNIPMKEEEFFSMVNSIRERKNNLFEKFITDKSRDLFNRNIQ